MSKWTKEDVQKALALIAERGATDMEFRRLCLEDPAQAISQVMGKELPAGFKLKFIESDPAYDMTYALPNYVGDGLSDQELDQVAGGGWSCGGGMSSLACVLIND